MQSASSRRRPSLGRQSRAVLIGLLITLMTIAGVSPLVPSGVARASDGITVADILDLLTYRIHTVRGSVDKTVTAVIGVPALVDVDRGLLPIPDLVVEVVALPTGQAAVEILRLTPSVPAQVELLFDLPNSQGVAYGYDARSANAPLSFTTALSFTRLAGRTSVSAALHTIGAGSSLGVASEFFTRGADGARVNPTRARLDLTPVPRHVGATIISEPSTGQTSVSLTSTATAAVVVDVVDNGVAQTRHVTGEIHGLPSSVDLDILSDSATGHAEAHYQASAPIPFVSATASQVAGTTEHRLQVTAESVPARIDLAVETKGNQEGHYDADAPLGRLDVVAEQRTAGAVSDQARIEVNDLARSIDVIRTGPTAVQLSTDGPVGSIEGGFASGGAVELLDEDNAYLHMTTDGAHQSVAARILGLESFSANAGDSIEVSATRAPGPFHVLVVDSARSVDAMIADLPGSTSMRLAPDDGTIEYHGDAAIGLITADIDATSAFLGRAKHAHVEVRDIPTDLLLRFGPSAEPFQLPATRAVCEIGVDLECPDELPPPPPPDGDDPPPQFPDTSADTSFVFDANGAAVGRIDVRLTDSDTEPTAPLLGPCDDDGTVPDADEGPDDALCEDGIIVKDLAGSFNMQGRLTGLQLAGARLLTEDRRNFDRIRTSFIQAHLALYPVINGGRPVRLELERTAPTPTATTDRIAAEVSNLPAWTTLTVRSSERVGGPSAVSVVYDAATPIQSIHLNARMAALPNPFDATITDVPTHFELCQSGDGRCVNTFQVGDQGSFRFDAASAVTLDAFLCLEPASGTCEAVNQADTFLVVSDVSLQHLAFEMHAGDFTEQNPAVAVFDTDDHPITGSIVFRPSDNLRVDVNFPGEFLVAFAGLIPNIRGEWTAGLRAQDLTVTAFDQEGLFKFVEVDQTGTLGCDAVRRWTWSILDLKQFFCGTPSA